MMLIGLSWITRKLSIPQMNELISLSIPGNWSAIFEPCHLRRWLPTHLTHNAGPLSFFDCGIVDQQRFNGNALSWKYDRKELFNKRVQYKRTKVTNKKSTYTFCLNETKESSWKTNKQKIYQNKIISSSNNKNEICYHKYPFCRILSI